MRTLTHILIAVFLLTVSFEQTAWARGGAVGRSSYGGRPSGMPRSSGGFSGRVSRPSAAMRSSGGFSLPGSQRGALTRPGGEFSLPGSGTQRGAATRPGGEFSLPGSQPNTATRPGGEFSLPGSGTQRGTATRPGGEFSLPGSGTQRGTATRPGGEFSLPGSGTQRGTATRPGGEFSLPGSGTQRGTRQSAGNVSGLPGDVGGGKHFALPGQPGIGGRPSTLPGPGGLPGIGGPAPGSQPRSPNGYRSNGYWHHNYNHRTIQDNFYNYGRYHGGCPYTHSWWTTYPGAAWTMYGATLGAFSLNSFGTIVHYFGDDNVIDQDPMPYNYGTAIYYEGDTVYVNNQSAGTVAAYYQQASTLASDGAPDDKAQGDDWMPLGVFAITTAKDTNTTLTVQLAVNKQGVIRGNQFDLTTGQNKIVKGSVDKKTQKVAWTAGDATNVVYETGLANLTEEQSTVMVHYSKNSSEVHALVHINKPPDDTAAI